MKQPAIIFDFGGVLFNTSATEMYREIFYSEGRSEAELEFFLKTVFTKASRSAANTGNMADVTNALAQANPAWAPQIYAFDANRDFIRQVRGTIPGMEATLEDIAARGHAIYGLTNWAADTFRPLHAAYQRMMRVFNDIVVSGEVGIKKPDAAIFMLAQERFGLDRQDVYYFDDKQANLDAAKNAVGWKGFRFETADTVRQALKL